MAVSLVCCFLQKTTMDFHGLSGMHASPPLVPSDSLDDFLADLRSNSTLALDLNGLAPDHALASGGQMLIYMSAMQKYHVDDAKSCLMLFKAG